MLYQFALGWSRLIQCFFRAFFMSRGTLGRLTPKRLGALIGLVPVYVFGMTFNWLGLFLDEILFPGYRKVKVHEPVFVVGMPRSGTTFLHRVLAKDTKNFTTMTMWEIFFAPSITQRYIITFLARCDRLVGAPVYRLLQRVDKVAFAKVNHIHHISLFEADEDDMLFLMIFACLILLFPFPFRDRFDHLARFDTETPEAEKARCMRFYQACIKRHLYFHGPELRFLSKNPLFTAKVRALRDTFPDGKFICNIRTPYESIASFMSLAEFYWNEFDNDVTSEEFREFFMATADYFYRHPMRELPKMPEDAHVFAAYHEITQHPRTTIATFYDRLGLPMNEEFDQVLAEEERKTRRYKSRHSYNLEQYGLTPGEIREQFGDVFKFHGFTMDIEEEESPEQARKAG